MKSNIVNIPDEVLRKSVEYVLNKNTGEDITQDEMASIKILYVGGSFKNLEGLQYAVNLITFSTGTMGVFYGENLSQLPDNLVNLIFRFDSDVDISRLGELQNLIYVNIIDSTGFSDFSKLKGVSPQLMHFEYRSEKNTSDNKSLDFISGLDNLVKLSLDKVNLIDEAGRKLYLSLSTIKTVDYLMVNFKDSNILDISDFQSWGSINFSIYSHCERTDKSLGSDDTYTFKNIFSSQEGPIAPPMGIVPAGGYSAADDKIIFTGTKNIDLVAYSVKYNGGNMDYLADVYIKAS
ncbi:hypothetical protein [Serratia marcescens]|uniref:hypothetical protein n=1 Tax=Serratia marcescens TaxID=615 RepID=UPI0007C8A8EE|nr:hypothetical protein [Serratia marcescens]OAH32779.1 hypothetical protein AYJ10_18760 [Serratia marcescens]